MTRQVGGGFCAACLVALALDEDEEAFDERDGSAPVHAYQVVSVLGREPGRVRYLARRQDFHAFVSLEIVSGSALGGATTEAIEARLAQLRSLRQPAVARLLESWRDAGGDWCLVSDYLAGRAVGAGLHQPSRVGTALARPLAIFERICDAVAAVHAQGVIHGRLGPESIVLAGRDEDHEPRITGLTITATAPALADDIVGLGRILAALATDEPFAAQAAALAGRRFGSLAKMRAAVSQLK